MPEKTKSLEKTPQKTPEASPPSRSPAPSVSPSGFGLAAIQGAAGNMAMQHAAREVGGQDVPVHPESALNFLSVRSGPVLLQRKLTIGSVDDPLEHEADRVAEHVMRMPARVGPIDSGAPQVQRKCACGGTCDSCRTDEEQWTVQRKSAGRPPIGAAGSSAATTAMNAPPIVHDVLRSPGQHLDAATRAFFEPRFGSDFGDVRVHTDSAASKSATAVNARAYTAGKSIVFAAGQYAPHSHAGQRLLAHELVHVVQQRNGVASPSSLQREPAGGCGLCYGDVLTGKFGARNAGIAAHEAIQNELAPQGVEAELPWGNGRVDVAVVRPISKEVAIGEIKPENERGIDDGIEQIEERLRVLPTLKAYAGYKWVPLDPYYKIKKWIRFPTDAPVCLPPYLVQPGYCYSQKMWVVGPVDGLLYLYTCEPSYSQLKFKLGCSCECKEPEKEPKDKEPKDNEPGPSPIPSLPELMKLGAKVWALLKADGLLSAALSLVGPFLAALTPLLALAALAVGIVFLWDKIKSFAHMIAGAAKFVWDKVSSVVALVRDTIKEIGIKIGELAVFVGGLIKDIAEMIAEGLLRAGRAVISGAKWLGGKIAEGAEAVWDWLFGSDIEPMIPNVELPITEEPTMHCGTVAREDALIQMNSDLLFPFGEWELTKLTPAGHAALNDAAAKVLATPRTSDDPIRFLGYTDVIGDPDKNQRLSEQRAQAVADWFVQHGVIPMSKVKITGFGETQAQAQYNDEEGRKKDRRVDILVTKSGSAQKVCW